MNLHILHLAVWSLVQYCSTIEIWKVLSLGLHTDSVCLSSQRQISTLATLKENSTVFSVFYYYMCLCACMS